MSTIITMHDTISEQLNTQSSLSAGESTRVILGFIKTSYISPKNKNNHKERTYFVCLFRCCVVHR